MNGKKIIYLLILIYLTGFSHCILDNGGAYNRGDIISSNLINTYSITEIRQLWTNLGIPNILGLHYPVEAIRIVYQTIDVDGTLVQASGAFMIPVTDQVLPLLSLQHGTESKRNLVASESPLNSIAGIAGLYMSSLGYLVCVPDYLGFGFSTLMHPYCHATANASVIIDFMRAAQKYCNENGILFNGKLFLSGYSEGGYLTLATQKEIEQNHSGEFNITAVAPMAGPYDLYGTIKTVFQTKEYVDMGYIGYLFTAYNDIYQWNRLDEIFNSPYHSLMPDLYDGTYTWGQIINQLPNSFSELINQNFRDNFLNGSETAVISAFQDNTLLNWTPQAPIRFFHGDEDQVVPYQNALTTVNNLKNNGGVNISLVTIKGGNHETSAAECFLGMILWFDQFN
ncbi:MAG: prolyl oligopeptidase family serine peptidase [Candidatus Aminicenantes bacterium]|nr:prolyl oligopeptidase family serine peptidase [Candidatus Aminicenantes bacterium]